MDSVAPYSRHGLPRRILKMSSDYRFFHLVNAVRSLRNTKSRPAIGQRRSVGELKLPEIGYSLLTSMLFCPRAGTALSMGRGLIETRHANFHFSCSRLCEVRSSDGFEQLAVAKICYLLFAIGIIGDEDPPLNE